MKKWIQAMRLRTLPLAASCILAGAAAAKSDGYENSMILLLTLCTTFLLQILSNFANDYGDYSHGVDNENRVGPTRAIQSGAISKNQMKRALIITTLLTLVSGISLLWFVFAPSAQFTSALIMFALGIGAIAAAIKYTVGNNPYGYRGLGDLFVFLFFGPVGVLGTCYLLSATLESQNILLAITTGFYSAAVLNLNNLRDHVNDAASGKQTLVVKMGFRAGKVYQTILIVIGSLSMCLWIALNGHSAFAYLPILASLAQCGLLFSVWKTEEPAMLDPMLKKVAILSLLSSLLLILTV
ncbi:MAG: 1,4-dihydroxy-2-naphthoate octaprenyltransferase [Flavobacteriales bacterium]|jgi:1,4-dihydroxy-2-naphthoate octaprenyltransferase